MIRRGAVFVSVCGFVCFDLLESERVSERAEDSLPDGPDPRDEGRTKKDHKCEWENGSPRVPGKWVSEVEEVGTHRLGYRASTASW